MLINFLMVRSSSKYFGKFVIMNKIKFKKMFSAFTIFKANNIYTTIIVFCK